MAEAILTGRFRPHQALIRCELIGSSVPGEDYIINGLEQNIKIINERILMKKILAFCFLLAAMAAAAVDKSTNWTGYGDTITMPACSSTALVYSTRFFSLTDFDAIRIVLHVDDTTSTGYAGDSISLQWGIQSFNLCYDTSGEKDTCYSPRLVIDTFDTDSLGDMVIMTLDAEGIANTPGQQVDTISCGGYAIQSRAFYPEWDVNYRLWIQGLTGNLTASPLKILFTNHRRVYSPVRKK